MAANNKDPAFLFYPSDFLTGTMLMSNEQTGKYITLLCLQHQVGHLSERQMKKICGEYDEDIYSKFIQDTEGLYFNERLEDEAAKRSKYCESRRQSRLKANEDEVRIYLIKDNETGYVKIGSSVNPKRRFAEMCNQKNPAITVGTQRKYELIFESRIVERKIESELHDKYVNKRVTGEWFSLSVEDIKNVRKTYDERTENENINENRDVNKEAIKEDLQDLRFAEFWQAYPRKVGKDAARKSWLKIKPTQELHGQIIDKVTAYKQSDTWKNENGRFIPNPATWLNQGRWEDEIYKQPSSNPFKDYYLKEVENEQNRSGLPNGDHQDLLPRILPPGCGD